MDAAERFSGRSELADVIKQLRNAALADDQGVKLGQVLEQITAEPNTAAA
jgi:hypothetical protein